MRYKQRMKGEKEHKHQKHMIHNGHQKVEEGSAKDLILIFKRKGPEKAYEVKRKRTVSEEKKCDANTTDIISKGEDKTRRHKRYNNNDVETSPNDSSKRKDDNTICRSSSEARAISKSKDPCLGILDKALNVAATSVETAGSVLRTLQMKQTLQISETTSSVPSTSGVSPRMISNPDTCVLPSCAEELPVIQQKSTLNLITRYILKNVKDNNSIKYYAKVNLTKRNSTSCDHNVVEANNKQNNLQQTQPKTISKSKNAFDIVGKNFNKSLFNYKRKQKMKIKNAKEQKTSPISLGNTIVSTTPSAKAQEFTRDFVDVLENPPNTEPSIDVPSNNDQGNSFRKEDLDLNKDNNPRTDIISDSSNLILKRGSELLSQFRCYNTDLQNNISYPNCLYSGRMRDPRLPHNRIKYTNKSQASITLDPSSNSPKDPFNKLIPGHENIPCTVEPNIAENIVQTSVFVDTSIVAQPQFSTNAFSNVVNDIIPVANTVSTQNGSHDANDTSRIDTNLMPHNSSLETYNALPYNLLQTDPTSNADKNCLGSITPQCYATDSYVASNKSNAPNPTTFTSNTSSTSSLPLTSSNMGNCTVESSLPQKANLHAQNKKLAPGEFFSICRANKPISDFMPWCKARNNGVNKEQSSKQNVSSETVLSFEVHSKVNKSLTEIYDIDDTRSTASSSPDPSTAANNSKSTNDSTRLQCSTHDVNEMNPKVPLTGNTQNGNHDVNGISSSNAKRDSYGSSLDTDLILDNSLSSFLQLDPTTISNANKNSIPSVKCQKSHCASDVKSSTLLQKDEDEVQSNESNNLAQASDIDDACSSSSPPLDPSADANKSSSTKNLSSDKLSRSHEHNFTPRAIEPNISEKIAQTSVLPNKCSTSTQPEHFTDASSHVEIKISSISVNTTSSKSGDGYRNDTFTNPTNHKTEFIDHDLNKITCTLSNLTQTPVTENSVSPSIQDQTDSTNVSNTKKTCSASTTPQLHPTDFASNGSIAKNQGTVSSKKDLEVHLNVTKNLEETSNIDDSPNGLSNNVQKPVDPIQSTIERDSSKNLAETSDIDDALFTPSLPPSTAFQTFSIKLNLKKSPSIPPVSDAIK